ncbi:MAG: ATP-binding protein [Paracoccaceae bacterium]
MTVSFNLLVAISLAYVALLFAVAFLAERRARLGRLGWLRSPLVYTLSLSIYCTAWTFYGAVGYAARSGLEFITIYLGPTLVFVGWWWILRKLVRIGRSQRVTSIADLISSRYGKSSTLGVVVTLICVVGITPYIALQLQSVALSVGVFAGDTPEEWGLEGPQATALWVAAGLALFTILFGTRNIDVNERHHGVVTAIALEAVVKLVALVAVGVFVVWGIAGGPMAILDRIDTSAISQWQVQPGRWAGLTFLSAAAILTLPRMFQVMVVENDDDTHLATAAWAFPLYLLVMSLFVVPIAVVGLDLMPKGSNPDLFVLTVPLSQGQGGLAMLAFLGGFSSATSMVIMASLALATMVSNHIVVPFWLALRQDEESRGRSAAVPGDLRFLVLMSRRLSIGGVLALGYFYFKLTGGSTSLAAIGLISFVGVSQTLPSLLGGIFWRGGTRQGAMAGLCVGFAIWLYALFLPSFGKDVFLSAGLLENGPLGIGWLRPQSMFGVVGVDPVLHALFWSLVLNTTAYIGLSLLGFPSPEERLQSARFVNVFDLTSEPQRWARGGAESEDLLVVAQRVLGADVAQDFFQKMAGDQGKPGYLPDATPDFIEALERRMAGSVGAAAAHAMVGQVFKGASVSVDDLMAVANETAQIREYSQQLEAKSDEIERTARQLRDVNEKLTALSVQKDAFLGQISHELRTPMTSIRAFSEIIKDDPDMPTDMVGKYSGIIHDETIRLTRLLDDLLDLSVLENGRVSLNIGVGNLHDLIGRAVMATANVMPDRPLTLHRDPVFEDIVIITDCDRLSQVFINLVSNARKYCDAARPELRIAAREKGGRVTVDFIDNGSGIPKKSQSIIFEKFSRLTDHNRAGGAGLGLAICREIMVNLGGDIAYLPGQGGTAFRVSFPLILKRPEAESVHAAGR